MTLPRPAALSLVLLMAGPIAACSRSSPATESDAGCLARDWSLDPAVAQVDGASEIWVVGDVHADYDRLAALLAAAKISPVPSRPSEAVWSAGEAVLVCTGDLIDKWDQALDVIAYLRALSTAASAANGRVIVTMGNHEAEFLAYPGDSKTKDFAAELEASGIRPAEVACGTHPVGQYLRSLPFAARVNDWFIVHAGNTGGATLANLEARLRAGVDASGFGAPVLSGPSSILEAKLDSPAPWWEASGEDPAAVLSRDAAAVGARHIIQGHEPGRVEFSDGTVRRKGTPYQKFGMVFLADVGMSRGIDYSTGALLHIRRDAATGKSSVRVVDATGGSAVLWAE